MSNEIKKITVLHITSSLAVGGAEAVLYALIDKLGHEHYEHHVIYFNDGPYRERLQSLGVFVYHVRGLVYRYDPLFLLKLWNRVRRIKPDCIHSLLWVANVFSRLIAYYYKIPCISVLHNNVRQDGAIRACVDRLTCSFYDTIVAVSEEVKESWMNRNYPIKKIPLVIANGIDSNGLKYQAKLCTVLRESLGLSAEHLVIGFVGRFHPVKNIPLLITSFLQVRASFPAARLILLGMGEQELLLRNLVDDYQLTQSVVFVVGKSALGYYQLFDCFAMASSYEGISIALLEAMSFGLSCVVTSTTIKHSVITHMYDGIIIPAESAANLAHSLKMIVGNTQLKKELGIAAQKTIQEKFGIDRMVHSYASLIKAKHHRVTLHEVT